MGNLDDLRRPLNLLTEGVPPLRLLYSGARCHYVAPVVREGTDVSYAASRTSGILHPCKRCLYYLPRRSRLTSVARA